MDTDINLLNLLNNLLESLDTLKLVQIIQNDLFFCDQELVTLDTEAFDELDDLFIVQRVNDRFIEANVYKVPRTFPQTFIACLANDRVVNGTKAGIIDSIVCSLVCITQFGRIDLAYSHLDDIISGQNPKCDLFNLTGILGGHTFRLTI